MIRTVLVTSYRDCLFGTLLEPGRLGRQSSIVHEMVMCAAKKATILGSIFLCLNILGYYHAGRLRTHLF